MGTSRMAVLAIAVTLIFSLAANAATIVESRLNGQNFAAYSDSGVGFPNSWSDSGAKSTAEGVTAGIGSRFNSNAGVGGAATWFQVAPTLDTPGGQYYVDVTTTSASGTLSGIVSTVVVTNGTIDGVDFDLATPGFQTDAFSAPHNTWNRVGTLTLNAGETVPVVRFEETANTNRFYADAVRFTAVPEPAALGALSLGALALLRRRRRRCA